MVVLLYEQFIRRCMHSCSRVQHEHDGSQELQAEKGVAHTQQMQQPYVSLMAVVGPSPTTPTRNIHGCGICDLCVTTRAALELTSMHADLICVFRQSVDTVHRLCAHSHAHTPFASTPPPPPPPLLSPPPQGPYFLGSDISLVDITFAPMLERAAASLCYYKVCARWRGLGLGFKV